MFVNAPPAHEVVPPTDGVVVCFFTSILVSVAALGPYGTIGSPSLYLM